MTRRRAVIGAVACAVSAVVVVGIVLSRDGTPSVGSVDVGFLQDMRDHHDQAVQMAIIELSKGESSIPKAFAADVIASQRYEIGLMDARLEDWGFGRGQPTRDVMTWMGMRVAHQDMPGLASQASVDELAKSNGVAADALFFTLMIEHHEGGLHMAEFAVDHAADERVRKLAARMIRTQSLEIAEMKAAQSQLGLT